MKTSESRRWWALGALSLSVLVVGLDLTVLNLALPTLATDLHASTAQLQWIVDAYSLVLAALVLPAGLLGDRFGRKKLLLGALLVFGAASLACAYASSAGALIAARGPRARRGLHHPAVAVGAARAVLRAGAAAGDHDHGGRDLRGVPDRPGPWRLAADPLLVGLGVPDQRPGDRAGPAGRDRAASGVAKPGASPAGPRRHPRVQPRPRRLDVRRHRGRAARLGRRRRAGRDARRRAGAGGVRGLGAPGRPPPGRPAAGRPDAVRL